MELADVALLASEPRAFAAAAEASLSLFVLEFESWGSVRRGASGVFVAAELPLLLVGDREAVVLV